jgi:UDP-N-acetylmuramoyl-L-alanyl-D-glutamate--2,6-diaminopimelate ligase
VLTEVNRLAALSTGRVITVLGCGGDRDASKRPLMAQEAQQLSHRFWLTSDNPRSEDPEAIARDMLAGLNDQQGLTIELQRDKAIAQAIAQATAKDWVVIAGKGHEAYQEVQGVRHPFSDERHAQAALNQWRAA